jgi:hypothetical protein
MLQAVQGRASAALKKSAEKSAADEAEIRALRQQLGLSLGASDREEGPSSKVAQLAAPEESTKVTETSKDDSTVAIATAAVRTINKSAVSRHSASVHQLNLVEQKRKRTTRPPNLREAAMICEILNPPRRSVFAAAASSSQNRTSQRSKLG